LHFFENKPEAIRLGPSCIWVESMISSIYIGDTKSAEVGEIPRIFRCEPRKYPAARVKIMASHNFQTGALE